MNTSPPCTSDPERWLEHPDDEAKWLCRLQCPIRAACARRAWETPDAYGLWAGIILPRKDGPARAAKFKQIAGLAGIAVNSRADHRNAINQRFAYRRVMEPSS